MPDRVIAIGDIHGCSDALSGLIEVISPQVSDTIVMLGDAIDRGPDSRGVVSLLLDLADRCTLVPIFGNHEEMLLAAIDRPSTTATWLGCGGRETLKSYGVSQPSQVLRDHVLYMRTWRDYFETATHFFAHGNYDPRQPLERQEWGFQRWESLGPVLPAPHESGKLAVLGHTSQKSGELLRADHLVCIDTFCCGGKWLTAYDTTNDRFYQVGPDGRRREK